MDENPYKAPGNSGKPRFKVYLIWLSWTVLTMAAGNAIPVLHGKGGVVVAWLLFMAFPGSILAGRVKRMNDRDKEEPSA